MIYLDNCASTRAFDCVAHTMQEAMCQEYANPASLHSFASGVEKKIEQVRMQLAKKMRISTKEIIFTSGGTESNNISILGSASKLRRKKWRFISGPAEHMSVEACFNLLANLGHEVLHLHSDNQGQIDVDELAELINEDTALVSIMHINNEFGTIADLKKISQCIKAKNPTTLFHSDGVQGFAHTAFQKLPLDLYSISAHKSHGPKGVGALFIKKGINTTGFLGGGQENRRRSGTLNVPAILGMGEAYETLDNQYEDYLAQLYDYKIKLFDNLHSLPNVVINGPKPKQGAPHILNLSFLGIRAETLLHALEEQQIYVGVGSACSSNNLGKNRVLQSLGIGKDRIESAIRFSIGAFNNIKEIDQVTSSIAEILPVLRRYKPR